MHVTAAWEEIRQVEETETIQKQAGKFRLKCVSKKKQQSRARTDQLRGKKVIGLESNRHSPFFSECSSEHHLHIKKAANKVVDLQQSTWIRVLLRGELMRHFVALQSCSGFYLSRLGRWIKKRYMQKHIKYVHVGEQGPYSTRKRRGSFKIKIKMNHENREGHNG